MKDTTKATLAEWRVVAVIWRVVILQLLIVLVLYQPPPITWWSLGAALAATVVSVYLVVLFTSDGLSLTSHPFILAVPIALIGAAVLWIATIVGTVLVAIVESMFTGQPLFRM